MSGNDKFIAGKVIKLPGGVSKSTNDDKFVSERELGATNFYDDCRGNCFGSEPGCGGLVLR